MMDSSYLIAAIVVILAALFFLFGNDNNGKSEKTTKTTKKKQPIKVGGPYTKEEVSKHCTEDDAWIIVDNKVFNVTEYVGDHVGGLTILKDVGGDSTKSVHGPQHPESIMDILNNFYIGDLKQD